MDRKEIIKSSINNSQYIIKERLKKFIKDYGLSIPTISDPYEVIDRHMEIELEELSEKFHDYEYDKSYKYFTLYHVEEVSWEDDLSNIEEITSEQEVYTEFDEELSFNELNPSIKKYDSLNELDIKFTLIRENEITGENIKYPIVATIFKDINLVSIKFCSVSERYIEEGSYIDINNLIIDWLSNKLNLKMVEFNSAPVFESLDEEINRNEDSHPNISIYRVSRQDENDGRSTFSSTRNDRLPIIDDIRRIAQTFESENDKSKILGFINRYEEESVIRNIALKWKHRFVNSNGKLGHIAVGINMINSIGDFDYDVTMHHIYQQYGINRERINYVIRFISSYSRGSQTEE